MKTIFENTGVQYESQGDYRLPRLKIGDSNNYHIGILGTEILLLYEIVYLTIGRLEGFVSILLEQELGQTDNSNEKKIWNFCQV